MEFQNILVTGGAGFIGSNLVLTLAERYPAATITVIDDFRSGHFQTLEGFKGDFVAGDVSQLDLGRYFDANEFDAVFHLASITDTTEHNQLLQVRDNVEGWRNLLDFFAGSKTSLVYASSAATYGIAGGVNHIDQPQKPANVYAFSKVQLENLTRRFLQEQPQQWVTGLRYFNVYGPREAHKGAAASMIYQLAQQMKRGQRPRIFQYGEQKRDFVYVKDIVDFTIAAAKPHTESGRVFNAGSGEPRSFNDIVTNLNRVLNLNVEAEYIENPYSFYQPHTEADMSRTIEVLGIAPQFTLEKGIDDYFASGFLA